LVSIICRSMACLVTSPSLTMMVSISEVPSAGGALQGTADQKVVGAGPQLSDDAESSLRDLVVRGVGAGVPESAASGDAFPAPGSSRTEGPGMSGLRLPGSPDFRPAPINWW
jgi:hypothetical protein